MYTKHYVELLIMKTVVIYSKRPIFLYSSSTCSTYDHAITTEKWKYHTSTQTTTISIYAFRFISSKEVTIRCNAHLCPTLHDDCSSVSVNKKMIKQSFVFAENDITL